MGDIIAGILVWCRLLIGGGSVFEGNEVFNGYAVILGMIVPLLSAVFFQLNLMQKDEE